MAFTDDELIFALKSGHLPAFETLYHRHRDAMLRVASRILNHRADAEDAVQNAFLDLFRHARRFKGRSSFATWLYRIVVNAALKCKQRRPAEEALKNADLVIGAHPTGEEGETAEILDQEIDALPMQQKLTFTLSEVEGFTLKEVGQILDIEEGTARYHLFKARERLRERLGPYLDSGSHKETR